MAERLMAPVLKTGIPERVSGVRIPPSPPESFNSPQHKDLPVPASSAQHAPLRQKGSQPYSAHFSKLILVSQHKYLSSFEYGGQEMTPARKFRFEFRDGIYGWVDRAADVFLDCREARKYLVKGGLPNHQKIYVARPPSLPHGPPTHTQMPQGCASLKGAALTARL